MNLQRLIRKKELIDLTTQLVRIPQRTLLAMKRMPASF